MSERASVPSGGRWNWFEVLSPEAVDALAEQCQQIELTAGENLYRHGQAGEALYQALTGRIYMRSLSASGRELLYTHVDPATASASWA